MTEYVYERIQIVLQDLRNNMFRNLSYMGGIITKVGFFKYPKEADLDTSGWVKWTDTSLWGGKDIHQWFRAELIIGKDHEHKSLALLISTDKDGWLALNPQFLLFINGKIKQGLDTNHQIVFLTDDAILNERYLLDFSGWSGMVDSRSSFKCSVVEFDHRIKDAYFDLWVALKSVRLLQDGSVKKIEFTNILNNAVNMLDLRKPHSADYYKSIDAMQKYLKLSMYDQLPNYSQTRATCIGHAHIDLAWLWRTKHTRQKTARTFASALELMDRYPEFAFMSSQPQLYRYIEEDYPELFRKIEHRITDDRWEVEGGMWVESDCNLTSGESLVRQILYGKRYIRQKFNQDSRIVWLPDTFGYNASLPQIMCQSGIDYFMTTKINWNQKNQLPVNSFYWQGIDGTQILSHIITTTDETIRFKYNDFLTTYNGMLEPKALKGAWDHYLQKNVNDEVLVSFGYGDGGGGVTWEMMEIARRLEHGFIDVPAVVHRKSRLFFDDLKNKIDTSKNKPKWVGELYLEYHRGTLTSMARNKRNNRKTEFLLQNAEWISSLGLLEGVNYPFKELKEAWIKLLYNQFHDILPGSSIKEVYEDSDIDYKVLKERLDTIIENKIQSLIGGREGNRNMITVFNPLSFERSDIVEFGFSTISIQDFELVDRTGKIHEIQILDDDRNKAIAFLPAIPSLGYTTFELKKKDSSSLAPSLFLDRNHLENEFFIVTLDDNAEIISIWDKRTQREVVKPGCTANQLIAYEDKPMDNDNWDIESYYCEKYWPVSDIESIDIVEQGPIRAGLRIKRRFSDSYFSQLMYIYRDVPRIDFLTEVDWKQDQMLLRVLFPVDIWATQARYDIPFGSIDRNTHDNTSWEQAAFEVPVHKWMDLSESNYGVALLNDCKYGSNVKDGVLGLSLIKSGNFPNEKADREFHRFTYSLYPHQGNWINGQTNRMAYRLNQPLFSFPSDKECFSSLLTCDSNNIVIETVKRAEDDEHALIVRLYEDANMRTKVRISSHYQIQSAAKCNLLEEVQHPIEYKNHTMNFEVRPFELVSLRIVFAEKGAHEQK